MVSISAVVPSSPQVICFNYFGGYLGAAPNQKIAKTEIKLRFSEGKNKGISIENLGPLLLNI